MSIVLKLYCGSICIVPRWMHAVSFQVTSTCTHSAPCSYSVHSYKAVTTFSVRNSERQKIEPLGQGKGRGSTYLRADRPIFVAPFDYPACRTIVITRPIPC